MGSDCIGSMPNIYKAGLFELFEGCLALGGSQGPSRTGRLSRTSRKGRFM